MDATRCYPLLLSIDYSQRKSKTIIRQDALDLTRVVTDLTFWYSGICNKDAKKLEKIYHELARKTRAMTKQTSKAVKEELITELKKQFPSVEECKASFINRRFTDNNFVKMVLAEIEKCNQQNGEMTLKGPKDVHLEHILPRNPDTSVLSQKSVYKI